MATGATNQPVVCLFVSYVSLSILSFLFSSLAFLTVVLCCILIVHLFIIFLSFFVDWHLHCLHSYILLTACFFYICLFVAFYLYSKEGKETNYSNRSKCGWQPEDAHCVQHSHIPSSYHSPRKYLSLISKIFVSILLIETPCPSVRPIIYNPLTQTHTNLTCEHLR